VAFSLRKKPRSKQLVRARELENRSKTACSAMLKASACSF